MEWCLMKRIQIYLDEESDRQLTSRADAYATTKSSLIRDAIAAYLHLREDEDRRLDRFRTAVRTAAQAEADLPSGAEYVREMRLAAVDAAAGIWSDRTAEELDDVMRFRSRQADRLPD